MYSATQTRKKRHARSANLQGEHGGEDTGQTESSWGEADVVGCARGAGAAATGGGRAGIAWVGEGALALVLALDDIGWAVHVVEYVAGAGDVGGRLEVEGTAVVLEGRQRDADLC